MCQIRNRDHKSKQKSYKSATAKEIENLRNIKGIEKMAAMPAPFLGAPLFWHSHPFLGALFSGPPFFACEQTSRYCSNEAKETPCYIMKKVANGCDEDLGAIQSF
jgi:hypothetical protein